MAFITARPNATPIELVSVANFAAWLKVQPANVRHWLQADFAREVKKVAGGQFALLPDAAGKPTRVLAVLSDPVGMWDIAALPMALPEGIYALDAHNIEPAKLNQLCIGWGLGAYQFTRYKKPKRQAAQLVLPKAADVQYVQTVVAAITRARDLINTPAEDLGPPELVHAARAVFAKHKGRAVVTKGAALQKNFPLVHAVGRAAATHKQPQVVDLRWANGKASKQHPKVTLVGKGVCFDTGGLAIKPKSGMYHMKKDMAGAATMLAVAEMVMALKLPIQLRLLIPAVENNVAGNSFRPSDVYKARNGLTVEIDDTDAEGRLILADCLAAAAEEKPDLIIDAATLGAGGGFFGVDITPFYATNDGLADCVVQAGKNMAEAAWRLPIWPEYNDRLKSSVADVMQCNPGPRLDGLLATLFLYKFIKGSKNWLHFDTYCLHESSRPGRPAGGEAQGARVILAFLQQQFGKNKGKTSG